MELRYIDAHCHLQFPQYDEDREAIIEQMREQQVGGIVIGCDLESSKKAVALAEQYDNLWASVGLHPNTDELFDAQAYRMLVASAKAVAIGECGLDYFRNDATSEVKHAQAERFRVQAALAGETRKPLIIHARPSKGSMDAYHDVLDLLREMKQTYPDLRGDAHFFVGGPDEAAAFAELDFTVSFTAVLTFAREYDETVRSVPLADILAETDAPYVAPASRRGERNDPLAVVEIYAKIADIRKNDQETTRKTLVENTRRLFALP